MEWVLVESISHETFRQTLPQSIHGAWITNTRRTSRRRLACRADSPPASKRQPSALPASKPPKEYLHDLGLRECRVRLHEGELARVEVPASELVRFAAPDVRDGLVRRLKELGFRFVTLDLEGFRSGSLNTLVNLEVKRLYSPPSL